MVPTYINDQSQLLLKTDESLTHSVTKLTATVSRWKISFSSGCLKLTVIQGAPLLCNNWKGLSCPLKTFVAVEEHMVKAEGRPSRLSSVKIAKSLISSSGPYVKGPTPVSIAGMAVVMDTRTSRQRCTSPISEEISQRFRICFGLKERKFGPN